MYYKFRSVITSQLAKITKAEVFIATIVKLGYSLKIKDNYQYNKLSNQDQKMNFKMNEVIVAFIKDFVHQNNIICIYICKNKWTII